MSVTCQSNAGATPGGYDRVMRLTLLALALPLFACSTTPSARNASTGVELVQLVGPAELNYPRGTIEVQFGLRITNQSGEAIKLRQIQMTPVGLGGAYRLITRT